MASGSVAELSPAWLKDFFPGYFALVMATGIVAIAAHLLRLMFLAWPLFAIALAAYPVLWVILLARVACFPRAVVAEFRTHERGPAFLTLVAATAVLGSQFAVFDVLTALLPLAFWCSLGLWILLVYGFLSAATTHREKAGIADSLNGSWLLLVVATESVSIMSALLASRGGGAAMTFFALAFYLLGALFYVLLSALILFRWLFHPMPPSRMDAPWWINMGAAAIATLAGTQLMDLLAHETRFTAMLPVLASLTVLLWTTSTFWIPLLVILFLWTMIQEGLPGYRPGLWSAVFPLGMYATATFEYAAVAQLSFLQPLPLIFFWAAFLAWLLTFAGMCAQFLRRSPRIA